MSICLKTDELLEALQRTDNPAAAEFCLRLEQLTQEMANELSRSLSIKAGKAVFEGVGLAGTACTLHPGHEGQVMPKILGDYDNATEWG